MDDSEHAIINGRYHLLGRIGAGGMGVVYRALDRLTGTEVALKRIALRGLRAAPVQSSDALAATAAPTPGTGQTAAQATSSRDLEMAGATMAALAAPTERNENPEQASQMAAELRLALAHEFRTLALLRHPHIISVLDYGFDTERQPFYTMELLSGAQTLAEAAQPLDLSAKVAMLLHVLQALTYLHRRGILHRDIKPQNALAAVVAGNLQVKLVDFGLAILSEQIGELGARLAGTLAYLAPELLTGGLPTEASELYGVGVMAYELLLGRLPFPQQKMEELIAAVLDQEPDLADGTLPKPIAEVVRRLLVKDPAARLAKAELAIAAFSEAIGRPPPTETAIVRESFLQSARFIGRDQELRELRRVLTAVTNGRGAAWLMGGESGVGKSRLLDELRAEALVKGALVLRGYAVSSGGGAYRVWQEILLSLCLIVQPTAFQASVLKPVVPSLPSVLGHDIPDAPTLDAQAANLRLLSTIEDLLFAATQPLMILLEDMHCADSESLVLLSRVSTQIAARKILILASYRDDERPQLPNALPEMHQMKLARLRTDSIADLSEAMLGEAGRRTDLVDLLQKETEGNAFFVIEVVRQLAEEVGQLSAIGRAALPENIMTGGIKAVLDRRLNFISEADQPLLQRAALAGRQLDLRVLRLFRFDLDAWLQACLDANVLEVSDTKWQFAHDKLRERLLEMLAADARRRLHVEVAQAIEQAYPGDPMHSSELAYHYREAGIPEKTLVHTAIAGEHAIKQGALQAAAALLAEASQLQERLGVPLSERTRVRYGLGHALHGLGRMSECIPLLEGALAQWGHRVPQRRADLGFGLAKELGLILRRRLRPDSAAPASPPPTTTELEEIFSTGMVLGDCYTAQGQVGKMLHVTLQGLNFAETFHLTDIMAFYYAGIGVTLPYTPLSRWSSHYHQKAEALFAPAQRQDDEHAAPPWVQYCYLLIGVSYVPDGDWSNALRMVTRARELARASAHEQLEVRALGALLQIWQPTSEFQTILDTCPRMYQLAERALTKFCIYSLAARACVHMRRGELDKAQHFLEDAKRFCSHDDDVLFQINVTAPEALLATRRGNAQARELVKRCLMRVEKAYISPFLVEDYGMLAEAIFDLWQRETGSVREELHRQFTRIAKRLVACGQRFARARAKAALWQGMHDWMEGRLPAAHHNLRAAIDCAARLNQPFDQAMAELCLGRVLTKQQWSGGDGVPDGRALLMSAWRLFARPQIGAKYYVERVHETFAEVTR